MAALRSGMGGGPTRSTRQAITPDALGSLWPLVVPALTAELGRAGVDVEQAADAVQDLAVRALSDDAPRDPLAFTVWIQEAARSYADELRAHAEPLWLDLDLLTDRPAINDVPYDAGRRLAFHAVLRDTARYAVMAVGMTFVIIDKDIDLSVGSIYGLVGVAFSIVFSPTHYDYGLVAALLFCGLLGVVLGLVNGLLVTVLRVPAFIATLTMLLIGRGLVDVGRTADPDNDGDGANYVRHHRLSR